MIILIISLPFLYLQIRLIALICMGVSFAIDPWCESFIGLLALSFLCGFGITFFNPGLVKAIRDIGGERNLSVAFAYTFFIASLGRLLNGFLTGE